MIVLKQNILVGNLSSTFRELRMQRFYLTISGILHVTHFYFPFLYWWAFQINQRLKIIFPFWKPTFILRIPQF